MGGGYQPNGNRRKPIWSFLLALLVVLVAVASGAGFAAGANHPFVANLEDVEGDADRVHLDIRVDEDGHAVWQVQYRFDLPTEEDRAAFADLESDIEEDPSPYTDSYRDRMETAADTASNATGRPMAIENVSVETETAEVPDPTGIVHYEFRWTNFAAVDGDSLSIGDALDGMFLDNETSLAIRWPDGLEAAEVTPEPSDDRSDAAVWRGPFEFSSGEPRITVSPSSEGSWAAMTPVLIIGGMALMVSLAVLGWFGFRRYRASQTPEDPEPEGAFSDVDRELLSNEEQVMRVMESYGGRMKQKELADELDWTAAKTSQVTTSMRESGRIEGFRLGRENVLKLPGEDSGEED